MKTLSAVCGLMFALLPSAKAQETPTNFDQYMYTHRYACVGPFAKQTQPQTLRLGTKDYLLNGSRLTIVTPDSDNEVKIGILSAIKDVSTETMGNLHTFMDWFKQQGVEILVVNGDLAMNEDDLDELLNYFGKAGLPTFILAGNSESAGSFARSSRRAFKQFSNVLNLGWVRHVVGDDFELLSLPGYHDRRFVHVGSTCVYKPQDIDDTVFNVKPGPGPLVLVTHGPPKGKGRRALDYTAEGDNVGDQAINELIKRLHIKFGIHGHILEAGGAIVDSSMKHRLKAGAMSSSLFLNAGTANGLPWLMNDGKPQLGMAAIMHIKGTKAAVTFKQLR